MSWSEWTYCWRWKQEAPISARENALELRPVESPDVAAGDRSDGDRQGWWGTRGKTMSIVAQHDPLLPSRSENKHRMPPLAAASLMAETREDGDIRQATEW